MEIFKILNPISKIESFPICLKQFANKANCKRHFNLVHGLPNNCIFCEKRIKSGGRTDLKRQHLVRCKSFLLHCKNLESLNELHFLNNFYLNCFKKHVKNK
jgi:hypothetical protein